MAAFRRAAHLTGIAVVAGLGAGLAGSIKSAVDFESAFAGVRKTVDASEPELAALATGIRRMSTEIPATTTEIAAVAEAAGQLGISTPAILGFTRTMVDLGETTNLSSSEAATALARLANIMQTPQTEFGRMGSTIVALGNNMATTESEIVALGQRLAAAGKIAGLSEADVLAFAATLTSVGVEAEAGGTALSKVFTRIRDAVLDGGAQLDTFASVAGVSAEQFSAAFAADPASAIASFVEGLDRLNKSGQSTTGIFKSLGLNNERTKRALLSTAGAGDLLRQALDLGNTAWAENSALSFEAQQRYATLAARSEVLGNKLRELGIQLGEALLPVLTQIVDGISAFMDRFEEFKARFKDGLNDIISSDLAAIVGGLLAQVQAVFSVFAALFTGNWSAFWNGIVDFFKGRWQLLTGIAGLALAALNTAIQALLEPFKAAWSQTWSSVKQVFSAAWDGIKSIGVSAINFIIDRINDLISGINAASSLLDKLTPGSTFGEVPLLERVGQEPLPATGPDVNRNLGFGLRGPDAFAAAGTGVTVNQTFNEKVDPVVVASEIAWRTS